MIEHLGTALIFKRVWLLGTPEYVRYSFVVSFIDMNFSARSTHMLFASKVLSVSKRPAAYFINMDYL